MEQKESWKWGCTCCKKKDISGSPDNMNKDMVFVKDHATFN